jgi:hypothetical protein
MFRRNESHQQSELFGSQTLLSEQKREKLAGSEEAVFYELIFRAIPEAEFAVLYSEADSRPNAPVNTLVAALILKHRRAWSYQELFDHIDFDLKTRRALGLRELNETPFVESTMFNFQNRLAAHQAHTGENLLERVFGRLTQSQLEALELKTSIQRADSFLAASNIRDYSRLQLIIEVLQRFCRILSEEQQEGLPEPVKTHCAESSGKQIYRLPAADVPGKLAELGQIYRQLLQDFKADYGDTEAWQILQRVFGEHFTEASEQVKLRPASQIQSGSLQSPDDPEATYRKKAGTTSRGQVIHVAETAHPDNPLNLITDVAVAPNNSDDAAILAERAPIMDERTPALDELHVDGGYGSDQADQALADADAALIQTRVKGPAPAVRMDIEPAEDGQEGYRVRCPHQSVEATRTPKQWKAEFDKSICAECPLAGQCPTTHGKAARRWYFTPAEADRQARWRRWEALPEGRKTLRANVEATIKEMKGAMDGGKLPVRGAFGAQCHGLLRAIGVNLGRIARYVADPDTDGSLAGLWEAMGERLGEFLPDIDLFSTRAGMPSGLVAAKN